MGVAMPKFLDVKIVLALQFTGVTWTGHAPFSKKNLNLKSVALNVLVLDSDHHLHRWTQVRGPEIDRRQSLI